MYKKILLLLIILCFQTSKCISREYNYEAYGLNLNFLNLKLNIKDRKIYSIIHSTGLAGHFFSFENIIQTTYDKNNLEYYFNLKKKNKEKIYQFKIKNGNIDLSNINLNKGKNYKSIKKTDLRNVLDPLTAVSEILYSNKIDTKCNFKKRIYDGDDVYEIFLTPKETNKLKIKFNKKEYKIIFVCRLNYKAISGHKFKREKKLNSRYLDIYFSKFNNNVLPTYFEAKSKIIPVKMYLSTVLNP